MNALDETFKISILDNLRKHQVKYEEIGNLGGHFIHFKDPSGNRFTVSANHGVIV